MSELSSLDVSSLLVGGVVLLLLLLWRSTQRTPGIPPGPGPALPLLGHMHLLPPDPRAQYRAWRRQYGDVFSVYVGGKLMVVLSGYPVIREALVKFADAFSDRPHTFYSDNILKNNGIVLTSGSNWKTQRKTALGFLRHKGMGKNVLEEKIQEEITHYIQAIEDHQGAPIDYWHLTDVSVSNNICSIVLGKRFDYEDSKFKTFLGNICRIFELLPSTSFMNVLPALAYLPGDFFHFKEIMANVDSLLAFVNSQVAAHQKHLMEDKEEDKNEKKEEKEKEEEDFISMYLHEIQKRKACGDLDTALNEANLPISASDLITAASETTSVLLRWAALFFLHYPHVQDKCFQEIADFIGHHRRPTMRDRPHLTYVEATVWEVLRKGDIVPFVVLHASAYDVMFRSYVIPKDAIIVPNMNSILQDPEIWGDPENFRPERFIGPDGKLTRPEEFIPFGIGRRKCMGEAMARMELFLYLTTLIQRFRFLPPEDGQLPSLEGVYGITHTPKPFKIRAVPRM